MICGAGSQRGRRGDFSGKGDWVDVPLVRFSPAQRHIDPVTYHIS